MTLDEKLAELEKQSCFCDIRVGSSCPVHKEFKLAKIELRALIDAEVAAAVGAFKEQALHALEHTPPWRVTPVRIVSAITADRTALDKILADTVDRERELGPCGMHSRAMWVKERLEYRTDMGSHFEDTSYCRACRLQQQAVADSTKELREALLEIDELIQGYVDVKDSDSGPVANNAMKAQQVIAAALAGRTGDGQ